MTRVEFISDCFNEIMEDYMRMYQDSSGAIVVIIFVRFRYYWPNLLIVFNLEDKPNWMFIPTCNFSELY